MSRKDRLKQDDVRLLNKWRKEIAWMTRSLDHVLKSSGNKKGFTLNPADGTVWDFENSYDRMTAFHKHSKNRQSVYFYSTTKGDGTISGILKIGYAKLLEEGVEAYVGRWINGNGKISLDSSAAKDDGITDAEMKKILDQYDQEDAAKIEAKYDENGNITETTLYYIGNQNES